KLTPLEEQVSQIQAANPDTMLLVEVGYKFRFFGPDAQQGAEILGIACFMDHAHLTASFPVPRLDIHVHRLVKAGKKVGVVRQMETAALKAAGDNRNTTFERRLCEVYTQGTYLDHTDMGGWILAIAEDVLPEDEAQDGVGQRAQVDLAIVAVRVESSEVVYDTFTDTAMRHELERRLQMLDVKEVLAVGELCSKTRRILGSASLISAKREAEPDDLPEAIRSCLAALKLYLAEFKLATVMTTPLIPFESKLSMQLPATTIASLELFHNSVDGAKYGTLFWMLDHTRTSPGKRLLHSWIARPLVHLPTLKERQKAVSELVNAKGTQFVQSEKLLGVLKRLPDLDRSLSKILYGKASRPEVLAMLKGFQLLGQCFDAREAFAFDVLNDKLSALQTAALVESFLGEIDEKRTLQDDKFSMFKESDALDGISDHKLGILAIETELEEHLEEIKATLKRKHVDYVSVAGIDYLIELKNDACKLVPKEWKKMSGTKFCSRFHTPRITRLVAERDQRKESLAMECDAAFAAYMKRIAEHYDTLRWIVSCVAELDCLQSLASVSRTQGYVCPDLLEGAPMLDFKSSSHPILQRIVDAFVPNDISLLPGKEKSTLLITGPNMGGKSSFVKQVALLTILAQIGCYVPAESAKLTLVDGVYCRMGASDSLATRESTFMVELHECADIMKAATAKSLVILDEVGRGTSTMDGLAVAYGVLSHFLQLKCRTLFVTHYPSLGDVAQERPGLQCCYMDYVEANGSITFLYKLAAGIAARSYGLNVAKLAGLPESLLALADKKGKEMEEALASRRDWQFAKSLL
ncbi:muts domain V-domain-containing protein, partial [Protomyces lactucae-debilis]